MPSRSKPGRTSCAACPLQACKGLRSLSPAQIAYLETFKQGELSVDKGTTLLAQGTISPHLYTILQGVMIRYTLMEDGRRQILNFMFPGDLVGLQGAMDDPLDHAVEALTPSVLCLFPRDRMIDLFRDHPRLGFDVAWLAAKEEAALEQHLVSLGQRSAKERIAFLALFLMERALQTGVTSRPVLSLSLTQTQIGDTLGLSLVHTNRTLQAMRRADLLMWSQNELAIPDLKTLRAIADYDWSVRDNRPFI